MKARILIFILLFCNLHNVISDNSSKRLALVIGNGDYPKFPLDNPINDATDLVQSLQDVGFTVIFRKNLTNNGFRNELRHFGERLKDYETGLFFYAGHGVQVNGVNYLLPVDADIKYEDEIQSQAIEADLVLRKMESAKLDVNILILDACRNNPFSRGFRGITPGLAVMNAPKGSIIAYSTAPGKTAEDGRGRNSPYVEHLLKNIKIPGITIEKLFKHVRVGLSLETKGSQISWESSSLMGDFYFISPDYFDVDNHNKTLYGTLEIDLKFFNNPDVIIDGNAITSCDTNICNIELPVGFHNIQIFVNGNRIERDVVIYSEQKKILNINPYQFKGNERSSYSRRKVKRNRSNSLPPP